MSMSCDENVHRRIILDLVTSGGFAPPMLGSEPSGLLLAYEVKMASLEGAAPSS